MRTSPLWTTPSSTTCAARLTSSSRRRTARSASCAGGARAPARAGQRVCRTSSLRAPSADGVRRVAHAGAQPGGGSAATGGPLQRGARARGAHRGVPPALDIQGEGAAARCGAPRPRPRASAHAQPSASARWLQRRPRRPPPPLRPPKSREELMTDEATPAAAYLGRRTTAQRGRAAFRRHSIRH